jgi:hypothetical protein
MLYYQALLGSIIYGSDNLANVVHNCLRDPAVLRLP